MEQVTDLETASPVWKTGILAFVLHLHILFHTGVEPVSLRSRRSILSDELMEFDGGSGRLRSVVVRLKGVYSAIELQTHMVGVVSSALTAS